jgi:trk system potassium uptake protein TrkA
MRVVILGCGKLGSRLALKLQDAGHRVIVLDRDPDALKQLGPNFHGERFAGTGLAEENITRALARGADVFVAATDKDNVNLMITQWVKIKHKVTRVIARVYDPILAKSFHSLGIETICPTDSALAEMLSLFNI